MTTLKPMSDRVLVELLEDEPIKCGIHIPEASREKPTTGPARACGPAVRDVKVGDTVMFPRYGGTEVSMRGKKFLLIREEDLLGIVG